MTWRPARIICKPMHGEGVTGGEDLAIPNGATRQVSRRISVDRFEEMDGWMGDEHPTVMVGTRLHGLRGGWVGFGTLHSIAASSMPPVSARLAPKRRSDGR